MRFLTDREEIATTITGRECAVVTIDLADADEFGLVSEPVVVDKGTYNDGFPRMARGHIRCYTDAKKFVFHEGVCGISASFGYYDVVEMAEYRNAPVIRKDSDVVLVVKDSRVKACWVVVLHTGKTGEYFVDNDIYFNKAMLEKAGCELRERA